MGWIICKTFSLVYNKIRKISWKLWFIGNDYWNWFKYNERILNALGASYKIHDKNRALHIDIYSPIATDPTWGGLNHAQKKQLMQSCGYDFKQFVSFLNPDIIVVSAKDGVQVGTELAWERCDRLNLPRFMFVNGMDEDGADIVRVLEDGSVRAYGSPWSGKTACYLNEDYPVGAFVQIKRSLQNKATLLNVLGSYAVIYSACSGIKFDRAMADGINDTISKLISSTRVFELECRPDAEAAKECYEAVK